MRIIGTTRPLLVSLLICSGVFLAPGMVRGVAVTPVSGTVIAGPAGHAVQFRQATAALPLNSVTDADTLFASASPGPNVVFQAFDNGISVINYSDFATDPPPVSNFGSDRDIRSVPGNGFGAGDQDNYAIRATGFIFIPTAGAWNFTVNSDDGFRLIMGTNNAVVATSPGPKGYSDVTGIANVPSAGYYPYELVYFDQQFNSGVEFFANGPGQATNQLVGSGSGTLTVFQSVIVATPTATSTPTSTPTATSTPTSTPTVTLTSVGATATPTSTSTPTTVPPTSTPTPTVTTAGGGPGNGPSSPVPTLSPWMLALFATALAAAALFMTRRN